MKQRNQSKKKTFMLCQTGLDKLLRIKIENEKLGNKQEIPMIRKFIINVKTSVRRLFPVIEMITGGILLRT